MLGGGFKMNLKAAGGATQKQKGYGLIKPRVQLVEEEEEEEKPLDLNEQMMKDRAEREKKLKKKLEREKNEVLAVDPTAYEYDEVFDALQKTKMKDEEYKAEQKSLRKKPKYITAIQERAKERQVEQDIIYNKMQIREMEKEKIEYGDTPKYMTSAYREKLRENEKWLEKEAKKDEEEKKNDVTKKDNILGFYSNLLSNNISMGFTRETPETVKGSKVEQRGEERSGGATQQSGGGSGGGGESGERSSSRESDQDERTKRKRAVEEEKENKRATEEERKKRVEEEERKKKEEEERKKAEEEEKKRQKFARKNTDVTINDAKARFLARKAAVQANVEKLVEEETKE